MPIKKRLTTEALRNQFDSTFHMAHVLVKVVPKEIWAASYNGVPFWQQIFGLFISQDKMLEYLEAIQTKTTFIFNNLDDEKVGSPVFNNDPQYTYTDVILGQIRHIMFNIGSLNGILRERGLPESDWYAYNEAAGLAE